MDQRKVNDTKAYTGSRTGQVFRGILVAGGDPTSPANTVLRRCSDVRISTPLSVTQVDEIGVQEVPEINYSREEPTRGSMQVIYTDEQNDNLPSSAGDLWDEPEYTLFLYDTNRKMYTDVIEGVRITEHGSGTTVNQQRMISVDFVGRHRLSGLQYKGKVSSANYPAEPV